MRTALLSALAATLCGCATIRYSDEGGRTMVDITNTGWYLFNFIPIASGNPDAPNECSCCLFRQTTTLENNIRLLDYATTNRNAKSVKSVNSFWTDENVLIILFKRHSCHISAELVMDNEDKYEDKNNKNTDKDDENSKKR